MEEEYISLKWGSLKAWDLHSDKCMELLKLYFNYGVSASAMLHHDSLEQKEILCSLIDECNAEQVHLDWDGKFVSKDEAKEYVMG